MRCPKCHYLSFDPDPRCRNCGYDLHVEAPDAEDSDDLELRIAPAPSAPEPTPDLPLRAVETNSPGKPATLELVRSATSVRETKRETKTVRTEPALAPVAVAEEPVVAPARRKPVRSAAPTTEMPLFVKTMGPQDVGAFADLHEIEEPGVELDPIVEVPATTRPLSVRRPFAEPSRSLVSPRRPGPLDHDLLEDLQRLEREEGFRPDRRASGVRASQSGYEGAEADSGEVTDEVSMSQRAGAAALDGLLLGGIGAFVLWASLTVAKAPPSALGLASLLPMGVFLAGVGIAYLLMFTAAGGQTVGKMLMGIRVVGDESSSDERVTFGQAASRAVLAPLSVLTLGLGWVPALLGRGPALHDRLAHTRVVRA